MKRFRGVILRVVFAFFLFVPVARGAEPVRLIFDTDMGNDVDDAMALAVIHALENRGECKLIAVTITKDSPYAGPFVSLLNTFYRRPNIPIGTVRNGVAPGDGKYLRPVVLKKNERQMPAFPHAVEPETPLPEAVALLRKTLAAQKDQSVVVVQVGFSTNLARLLESGPDSDSPWTGTTLVQRKVRFLSIMAGAFDPAYGKPEYNIREDVPSATKVIESWPTPIVFSGVEIGLKVLCPSISMKEDYQYVKDHPVREAYLHYRTLEKDQPLFDLTSVLYAVRPNRGYFDLSEPGTVLVDKEGRTTFKPDSNGKHRFMTVSDSQIVRVRELLCSLCSEPPKK